MYHFLQKQLIIHIKLTAEGNDFQEGWWNYKERISASCLKYMEKSALFVTVPNELLIKVLDVFAKHFNVSKDLVFCEFCYTDVRTYYISLIYIWQVINIKTSTTMNVLQQI